MSFTDRLLIGFFVLLGLLFTALTLVLLFCGLASAEQRLVIGDTGEDIAIFDVDPETTQIIGFLGEQFFLVPGMPPELAETGQNDDFSVTPSLLGVFQGAPFLGQSGASDGQGPSNLTMPWYSMPESSP